MVRIPLLTLSLEISFAIDAIKMLAKATAILVPMAVPSCKIGLTDLRDYVLPLCARCVDKSRYSLALTSMSLSDFPFL